MRFTIIATKPGQQPPQSSCDFLPPGGTIGRGADNNLVLPDDDRTISRLQAIVHITADGECRITNRGNVTLVHLNDIPLERGRQVDLQEGDILSIDDYRLQVSEFSSAAQPVARPAQAVRPAAPKAAPAHAAAPNDNIPAAIPSEIWDSLAQEFSITDSLSSRGKPAQSTGNPLTEAPVQERNPVDPLAQFAGNPDSLNFDRRDRTPDALFNKDELFDRDSIFDDSTPSTLMQQPAARPQASQKDELDPLALFGGGSAPAQVNSDDPLGLMMGNAVPLAPLDEPEAAQPQPVKPASQPQGFVPPAPKALDSDFDLLGDDKAENTDSLATSPLFDEPTGPYAQSSLFDEQPVEAPAPQQDYGGITLPTPQAVARSTTPPPKGRLRIDPVSNPVAQQGSASASGGEMLEGELLGGLIDGMGLNDLQPTPRFDRDAMQELGQMLSMFSQGTVALLSSRSILKRGVKAEMTVILDEANNPFKLLPSGKSVLMQMFGSRMPGFMPPKQSVRDALVDLQAHQLGMIAGIRAIIASMLQSFNPQQLEEEARQEGATSRLSLPASRKAALWEHFTKRYGETAGEIEDDFHTLFGEAFLHAYDMEVNQYKDSQIRSEE
ncbi:type VI secretion system-associated FHA domain protein TagH [Pantoea sp. BAV 3049]|uniref:type VI secretion system-associated FHA domain protein TagH n=1 Tax=Pantoea sp. BAV 3049 TaxID=2654188 RepID=UPI00131DD165|nr:type VI secretion system-associated FHA domain protein TagH [Pantoea sp. BAV 3049]